MAFRFLLIILLAALLPVTGWLYLKNRLAARSPSVSLEVKLEELKFRVDGLKSDNRQFLDWYASNQEQFQQLQKKADKAVQWIDANSDSSMAKERDLKEIRKDLRNQLRRLQKGLKKLTSRSSDFATTIHEKIGAIEKFVGISESVLDKVGDMEKRLESLDVELKRIKDAQVELQDRLLQLEKKNRKATADENP